MKHLVLLIVVACFYATAEAENCARPNLSRVNVNIYSTIGKVPVRVSRCLFNDTKDAYSDISNNCVKAFQSGLFVDKWSDKNVLADKGSPIVLEEYVSKADLVKNEVTLRSGGTCRYDRGFCYDPTETNTYAIVWEILEKPEDQCPPQIYKVFEGEVDLWEFKLQGLNYLFYYDPLDDEAFYLSLDKKGECQNTNVWYTEEGYIVSLEPLKSKDIQNKASLKTWTKGGTKGGVKGGTKGGRMTLPPQSEDYFSLRSKKVVSENILKNCDIRSMAVEELIEEVDSGYLDNPVNLHLILKRYYLLVVRTREELLELIRNESLVNITRELKHELEILSEHFAKTTIEVRNIQMTLEAAGNLKGIRLEVDTLALQLAELLTKNEEYNDLFQQISVSIKKNSQEISVHNTQLESLSEKIEHIQNIINKQIPEYITKTEVYDKINKVEQDFHQKLKDLAMNVTLILLNHEQSEGAKGVKGKGKAKEDVEDLILEKLKSFNIDQCQASIDSLKEKTELALNQLRYESYNNQTFLEDKVLKKLADLAAQNGPILARLNEYEEKINELFLIVKSLKLDAQKHNDKSETVLRELETKITKIFESLGGFDTDLIQLKKEIVELTNKVPDFTQVYEKVHILIQEALQPRDNRLTSLEIISVKLSESIEKGALEFADVEKQIQDILEALKKLDSVSGVASETFDKEVLLIEKRILNISEQLEELSKKQTTTDENLHKMKEELQDELNKIIATLKELINTLNVEVVDNKEAIMKLQDQDKNMSIEIETINKNLAHDEQSIKNLEELVKEKCDSLETSNSQNSKLISVLKVNVTELYDTIKRQEDVILMLRKNNEKAAIKGGTKGGVKTSGRQRPEDSDEEWEVNYQGHGHTDSYTKTSRGHSGNMVTEDITYVVEKQQSEISQLRSQLAEAHIALDAHEHRIDHLEVKLDQLLHRVLNNDNSFLIRDIKLLDNKLIDVHDEIVHMEDDLNRRISQCCNTKSNTKSYTKSSYTKSPYHGTKN